MGMVLMLKQREIAQNYPMFRDYVVKLNIPCRDKSPGILTLGIVWRMLILKKIELLLRASTRAMGTASVVWWSEFLAADPKVSGSIPGATRFSEK
jgi:hypothetical protein